MASPMQILRKHQKELMVIFTGMAIFSWLVIDSIDGRRSANVSPTVLVTFFAMIGAGAGYVWNIRQKDSHYSWLTGGIVGTALGLVLVSGASSKEPGIASSTGKITLRQIGDLRAQRDTANNFVQMAFAQRKDMNQFMASFMLQRFMFGSSSIQEIVAADLLVKEADHYGIAVSNEYINDFIEQVSDKQMDEAAFSNICANLGLSQIKLFDILRKELKVRLAMQLLHPETLQLPQQFWSDFQKFNVRQTIDATAIPVDAFAASVDSPSEGDLKKLFDEFKALYPTGSNPGFRAPQKKRLAYLTASYENFEKKVGDITEDELKKLYEDRKDTFYKADSLPDSLLDKDNKSPLGELKLPAPSKPSVSDEGKKEDAKSAEPNSDEKKPTATDAEKKPDAAKPEEKKPDEPKTEEKKSGESGGQDGCVDGQESDPPPKAEDKQPTDKPETKTDSTDKPAAASDEKKPAEEKKYKPFEDVRDDLREIILRQRAQDLLREAIDAAMAYITETNLKIGEDLADANKDKPTVNRSEDRKALKALEEERGRRLAEKVKSYAQDKGFTFEETSLVSFEELTNSKDIKLASASEPFDLSGGRFVQPEAVPTVVFNDSLSPFTPAKAEKNEAGGDLHFVYWITDIAEEHVPEFTDEGVKAAVEKAWRLQKARPKAQVRAEELAKSAREAVGSKSLSESVTGMTVTGSKESVELSVIGTPPFSWLRQSTPGLQMNSFQGPQIEFGFIPGIEKVDNDFMKSIYEMNVGDVTILPNSDKSVYYVVHLKDRSPSDKPDDPGLAALRQQFLTEDMSQSRIYQSLAQSQSTTIRARWLAEFMRKYGVDVNALEQF